MAKFPITPEGFAVLSEELNYRMRTERPRLVERIGQSISDEPNLAKRP